jgi:preprotein translocase subunit YajC
MLEDLLVGMVSLIPILIILTPIGLVVFFVIRRGKRKKQGKTTTQEKIED